jgi:FMN-dependent NADH-azoreductase
MIFAFMGINDVSFVYAEGLNMGDDIKAKALEEAKAEIS